MSAPRLGFVGAGWIGSTRMQAVVAAGAASAAVVADPDAAAAEQAAAQVGCARVATSLEQALEAEVDGIVLATPSALHAAQSLQVLSRGLPVFCQKPLGRTGAECLAVVAAAREGDLLLGVDLSYRFARAFAAAVDAVRAGDIGDVYAVDLVFHNAYGPEKAWFTDPALSGGGCVIDLGTHLVDLALQALPTKVTAVTSKLFAGGRPLVDLRSTVEDYAIAQLELATGAVARLACSWFLPAGVDAIIEAHFHGTQGGLAVRNVGGSFYDFVCDLHIGRDTRRLAEPPDVWGGRALIAWARRLADGSGFDPDVESIVEVGETIDRIYGRAS